MSKACTLTPIPPCQGDCDVDPEGPRVLCDSDGGACGGLHSDCVAPEVTGGTATARRRPWHPGTNIPVCSSECTGASHGVQTAGDSTTTPTQTSPSILLLHQVEVLKGILQTLMGGRGEAHSRQGHGGVLDPSGTCGVLSTGTVSHHMPLSPH